MLTPDEQRPRSPAQRLEMPPTAAATTNAAIATTAADPPRGPDRALRLFRADLDAPPLPFTELASVLDAPERVRARRIRGARHRARWIASRGLLRHLLAHETDRAPGDLRFRTTPRGKPFLDADLAFNLSHSGRHLLVVLAPAGDAAPSRVGVDVEVVEPVPELEELVRRWFGPAEAASILGRPARAPGGSVGWTRLRSFVHAWVRKEAFVKGVGIGIGASLDAFEVVTRPTECLASDVPSSSGPWARSAARLSSLPSAPSAPLASPPSSPRPVHPDHPNLLRRNRLPGEADVPWQVRAVRAPDGVAAAVAWDRPDLELCPASWPW